MIENKQYLIDEYVKFLREKSASVFLGSGMSYNILKINWEDLIGPFAKDIGLDLSEVNNIDITQYYIS